MKFLIDAHLPRRMVDWFVSAGCDALHTLDLPRGNRTSDDELTMLADREERALITKDADFVDSYTLQGHPAKLLLISTGNISNSALESLLRPMIPLIVEEFNVHSFLELGRTELIVRG